MTNASLRPELVERMRPGTLKVGKLVEEVAPTTNASPAGSNGHAIADINAEVGAAKDRGIANSRLCAPLVILCQEGVGDQRGNRVEVIGQAIVQIGNS